MAVTACRHEGAASQRRFQRRHAIPLVATGFASRPSRYDAALDMRGMRNRKKPCTCGAAISNTAPTERGGARWRLSGRLRLLRDQIPGRACRPRSRSGGHRPSPGTKDRRGYGHVGPSGFTGLLHTAPMSGQPPEGGKSGALSLCRPVVGNQLDLDVEGRGAKRCR